MKSCYKTLLKITIAILLMHLVCNNRALARVHPPSSLSSATSSSSQALLHTHSDKKKPVTTEPVFDSLRRIPPSIPNPTQNNSIPITPSLNTLKFLEVLWLGHGRSTTSWCIEALK
ncbi:hypothetical protein ACE6H2_006555 [Prunus campanulata]